MSQIGIRCAMRAAVRTDMKNVLKLQLREYHSIEREARSIATSRGYDLPLIDPLFRFIVMTGFKVRLPYKEIDSKIAVILIRDSTNGMIRNIRNLRHLKHSDIPISILSQKLLDCEVANIQKMQGYL